MKNLKEAAQLVGTLSLFFWIPLGIAAFAVSPVRVDIKLVIAAGVSFVAMLAWYFKNGPA